MPNFLYALDADGVQSGVTWPNRRIYRTRLNDDGTLGAVTYQDVPLPTTLSGSSSPVIPSSVQRMTLGIDGTFVCLFPGQLTPPNLTFGGTTNYVMPLYHGSIADSSGQFGTLSLLTVPTGDVAVTGGPAVTYLDGSTRRFLLATAPVKTATGAYTGASVPALHAFWLNGTYASDVRRLPWPDAGPGPRQMFLMSDHLYTLNAGPMAGTGNESKVNRIWTLNAGLPDVEVAQSTQNTSPPFRNTYGYGERFWVSAADGYIYTVYSKWKTETATGRVYYQIATLTGDNHTLPQANTYGPYLVLDPNGLTTETPGDICHIVRNGTRLIAVAKVTSGYRVYVGVLPSDPITTDVVLSATSTIFPVSGIWSFATNIAKPTNYTPYFRGRAPKIYLTETDATPDAAVFHYGGTIYNYQDPDIPQDISGVVVTIDGAEVTGDVNTVTQDPNDPNYYAWEYSADLSTDYSGKPTTTGSVTITATNTLDRSDSITTGYTYTEEIWFVPTSSTIPSGTKNAVTAHFVMRVESYGKTIFPPGGGLTTQGTIAKVEAREKTDNGAYGAWGTIFETAEDYVYPDSVTPWVSRKWEDVPFDTTPMTLDTGPHTRTVQFRATNVCGHQVTSSEYTVTLNTTGATNTMDVTVDNAVTGPGNAEYLYWGSDVADNSGVITGEDTGDAGVARATWYKVQLSATTWTASQRLYTPVAAANNAWSLTETALAALLESVGAGSRVKTNHALKDGLFVIKFWAVDSRGSASTEETLTLCIDKSAPKVQGTNNPLYAGGTPVPQRVLEGGTLKFPESGGVRPGFYVLVNDAGTQIQFYQNPVAFSSYIDLTDIQVEISDDGVTYSDGSSWWTSQFALENHNQTSGYAAQWALHIEPQADLDVSPTPDDLRPKHIRVTVTDYSGNETVLNFKVVVEGTAYGTPVVSNLELWQSVKAGDV